MELFFFIILAIIFFGIFGDGKKQKPKPKARSILSPKASSILSPKGVRQSSQPSRQDYPSDWKNYEDVEQGRQSGMQDDLDPSALYKISKDRIELARKAAADKLSDSLQSFETSAKNSQAGRASVAEQPPLVRDMNLSRKLFLSGGSNNTFGERQKDLFSFKNIIWTVGLIVIAVYMIGVLS